MNSWYRCWIRRRELCESFSIFVFYSLNYTLIRCLLSFLFVWCTFLAWFVFRMYDIFVGIKNSCRHVFNHLICCVHFDEWRDWVDFSSPQVYLSFVRTKNNSEWIIIFSFFIHFFYRLQMDMPTFTKYFFCTFAWGMQCKHFWFKNNKKMFKTGFYLLKTRRKAHLLLGKEVKRIHSVFGWTNYLIGFFFIFLKCVSDRRVLELQTRNQTENKQIPFARSVFSKERRKKNQHVHDIYLHRRDRLKSTATKELKKNTVLKSETGNH